MHLEEAVVSVGVVGGGGCGGGLQGVPAKGVHGDLGGGQGVETLDAHGGRVPGVGGLGGTRAGAAAALITVPVAGDAGDGRGLEVVRGTGRGPQLFVPIDEHVHGQHPDHLGDDEGQGPEVEGPAVGIAVLLGVALGGVSGVGGDVHDNANDVAQTWEGAEEEEEEERRRERRWVWGWLAAPYSTPRMGW